MVWTAVLLGFFAWFQDGQQTEIRSVARAEARSALERDLLYRRWGAFHGGVYVPVTENTPPNPYLSHVPERDIVTPSGRHLTLVNPSYMTRQVYELTKENERFGKGHITSLKPLRPENAPDPWEAEVLRSFERGVTEAMEIKRLHGKPYLRLMRPFVTEASCLKCHANQGYREEETRGGINEPAVHEIKYKYAGAASDEPEQVLKLYVFQCTLAAYNETQVYYLQDSTGLHPLSFSEPNMVIKHKAGDEEGKTLESMKVRGFTATTELVNSEYDPATKTITSFSKWRGIGDASSNGTWKFVEGQFVLDDYSVDPTYDEEMNSISVFSNGQVMLK